MQRKRLEEEWNTLLLHKRWRKRMKHGVMKSAWSLRQWRLLLTTAGVNGGRVGIDMEMNGDWAKEISWDWEEAEKKSRWGAEDGVREEKKE